MKRFAMILLMVASVTTLVAAGASPPGEFEPIRGVVSNFDGKQVVLKTSTGLRAVDLTPDWKAQVMRPIDVAHIREGSFIGTAEMPQPDGTGRSLEVHVFPPGMKGGEGHYPWTLRKGSMMTNGTVGKVTAGSKGRELEVTYSTGTRRIVVPPNVPVVQIESADRSVVKVGAHIFVMATPKPDGGLVTANVGVGADGAKPPM